MNEFTVHGQVAASAVATAYFRWRESERPDRLFADPYARDFVVGSGIPRTRMGLNGHARAHVYESVVARTVYLDRVILSAVARGIEQVVLLGAGLDARAWRLELPADIRCFEVDAAELLEFKDSVVASAPTCRRITVAADPHRPGWSDALCDSGFEAAATSVWIAEGLMIHLGADDNARLTAELASVSRPGSVLGLIHFGPGARRRAHTRSLADQVSAVGYGLRSHLRAPGDLLPTRDWEVEWTTSAAFVTQLGRTLPTDEDVTGPMDWLVTATRRR